MRVIKIIGWIVLGVVGAAAIGLGLGIAVMLLWNWLLPPLLGVPEIGYWQAVGLFILCHLLFKGQLGGHGQRDGSNHKDNGHRFAQRVRSLVHGEGEITGSEPATGA
ncbi:MAG: hypothetical protein JXR83_02230 [Deltaproteobacteria bacterium]|nr:hypothetical protein [Deltaproteobacteria bacterium]